MTETTSLEKKITKHALTYAKRNGVKLLYDTEVRGFFARFNVNGTATLNYRYRSKLDSSHRPVIKLGVWPTLDPDEARKIAKEHATSLSNGIEPKLDIEREKSEKAEQKRSEALKHECILGNFIKSHYAPHMLRNKRGDQDVGRLVRRFGKFLTMDMNTITKSDVHEAQIAAESMVGFQTFKRDYAVLQGALNYAVEMEVIKTNPISGVSLKRPKTDVESLAVDHFELGERRALTPTEIECLFKGLDKYTSSMKEIRRRSRLKKSNQHLPDWDQVTYVDHVVPVILFMYYTGFRNGDVLGLRWEHFNTDFSQVSKVIEKIAHHGKGKMHFPLNDKCREMIETWWKQDGQPTTGWVFYSPRNRGERRRLSEGAMRKSWLKIKQLGGLDESLELYTLRHNFASQHIMSGTNIEAVRQLMGHSDIKTTMEHYSHLTEGHLRDAIKKAGPFF